MIEMQCRTRWTQIVGFGFGDSNGHHFTCTKDPGHESPYEL